MSNELPPSAELGASSTLARPSADFEGAVIRFVSSTLFDRVFREGMALVEDTAAYLDGPGREDSKELSRAVALAYAGESMRLTTRLMQVASWLLVQRAIEEGEMTPYEALSDKYRLGAAEVCRGQSFKPFEELPDRLQELLVQSEYIYDQVSRLDEQLYQPVEKENVVAGQVDRLQQLFGGGRRFDV